MAERRAEKGVIPKPVKVGERNREDYFITHWKVGETEVFDHHRSPDQFERRGMYFYDNDALKIVGRIDPLTPEQIQDRAQRIQQEWAEFLSLPS